jgi:O-antigen/teichoic acid export membrane protein
MIPMNALRSKLYALLRWSEKYTKTDMVYLASGGFWLSLSTFATAAATFGLSIAFANFISPESYGVYKYILSLAAVFGAFTLTGLETAVVQATSQGREGVLREAFKVNLLWSIPMAVAATVAAIYYGINGNLPLSIGLLCIAFIQPVITSAAFAGAFVNGKKLFRINAVYYAARTIVPAIALLGSMLLTDNPLALISVNFAANLLVALVMYFQTVRRQKPNTLHDASDISYAKHLSWMGIFSNVADNVDKILTFQLLGAAPLAIYSFSLALPSQSKLFTKSLANLMLPKFAERPEEELRAGMEAKMFRFFLLWLVAAAAYIIIAPYIFRFIFPRYIEAVFLSQIYAVSLLAGVVAPINIFLLAKRKIRAQYAQNILIGIFQIVSAGAGIMVAGLLGLVISRIITRFAGAGVSLYYFYFDKQE